MVIHQSTHPNKSLSNQLFIKHASSIHYPSTIHLTIYPYSYPSIYPSVCPSTHPSMHPKVIIQLTVYHSCIIHPSVHLTKYPYSYQSIHLIKYPWLSIYPVSNPSKHFFHPSSLPSIPVFIQPTIYQSIHQSSTIIHLTILLTNYASSYPSFYLSIKVFFSTQ